MTTIRRFLARARLATKTLFRLTDRLARIDQHFEELKINQGIILAQINRAANSLDIKDYEFKVFSQWGEDGIIQHLLDVLEIKNRTFIEFGVEDFSESNCRFLLMKDNWRGFVIDGSRENIARLRSSHIFWKYDIQAVDAFITRENINDLLSASGFDEDLGILSIDIDGNDYHVLEAIHRYKPRILVCEYNAVFGKNRKISVPYDPAFYRTQKHYSNLYFGCSLAALVYLANKKGYSLVGTNSIGGNAFFVRNDLLNERLQALAVDDAYFDSNIRESRDERGQLTYLTGTQRLATIKRMPVLNVETGNVENL